MSAFDSLAKPILDAFPELQPEDVVFAEAPKPELGDVALRTFEAAKRLKSPPPKIATEIADKVDFGSLVTEINQAGPYLNLKLDRGVFGRHIVGEILSQGADYGSNASGKSERALVEHTSINPNASPHVGRARNAMIGDSLVRLLKFEQYDVETHYYVNDIGKQIALLVLACESPQDMSFDDMLDCYAAANARAEEDEEFEAAGYAMLAKIEEGDPEAQERFRAVTDLCLQGQLAVLGRLGIAYDIFERESQFVKDPRVEDIIETLAGRGATFTDDDDRLVVDLQKIGHEPDEGRYSVLKRSNGSSMYWYRDIAYTLEKLERGADHNFIVLGEDHKLYAHQLDLILQSVGKSGPEPIHYAYILLKEGKMSTRKGQVVLLSDFLDEATARAAENVNEQCKDLPEEERQAIAEQVAVAAVRFAILRVNPNKNVIFDWDASLSFSGDTGPYIQYSCARIASILRKFGDVPDKPGEDFPVETGAEWALLMKLESFNQAVAVGMSQRSCAPVAQFALETARMFTTFYHECPVLDAKTDAQKQARAQLCAATRRCLANALDLLGIVALERM